MMTTKQAVAKILRIEAHEAEVTKIETSHWQGVHWKAVGNRWDSVMGQLYDNGGVVLTDKAKRHIKSLNNQIEKYTNSFNDDPVAIAAWETRYGVGFEVC